MGNEQTFITGFDGKQHVVYPLPDLHVMLALIRNGIGRGTTSHNTGKLLGDVMLDGHTRNKAAGWWSNIKTGAPKERNVGELLMLAVSELAEVPPMPDLLVQHDDKLPGRLMGEVEVADFLIRMFDTLGALCQIPSMVYSAASQSLVSAPIYYPVNNNIVDILLMGIVREVATAMEGHRKGRLQLARMEDSWAAAFAEPVATEYMMPVFDFHLMRAVILAFRLGEYVDYDLPGAIVEKMAFNASRADHKIDSRLGAAGKQY